MTAISKHQQWALEDAAGAQLEHGPSGRWRPLAAPASPRRGHRTHTIIACIKRGWLTSFGRAGGAPHLVAITDAGRQAVARAKQIEAARRRGPEIVQQEVAA